MLFRPFSSDITRCANSIRFATAIYMLLLCTLLGTGSSVRGADPAPEFEKDVAPILIKRCLECHQSPSPSGDLSLTTEAGIDAGGDSGAAIDRDFLLSSQLLQRVVDGEMPPDKQGQSQRLPDNEIKVLRNWIALGAHWPTGRELELFERSNEVRAGRDWWSLQPILSHDPPKTSADQHPIDAFVREKLSSQGMRPAPQADRRTLLRRLYYDLIGLPPTEQEIADFVSDKSRDAWEKQVDALLDRPQYGERWGRHWLDVVRYADTSGYERDQEKRGAWRYRDWVVRAFNEDMPYSQFVMEQLAGDELPVRSDDTLIATGFLRLGSWNDEPNDPKDYVYDRLEDMVHVTASSFLGLTVKCARCHTHKFDPIEQDDYYRFASVFWPGPIQPRDPGLLGGPDLMELGNDSILGWTDVTAEPKPLHVLRNGERDQPMHEIVPASLSTVPDLFREFDSPSKEAKTTGRRRQLAQWITDEKNPLTARVIVNRIWLHHFGQGIVRTPNNFGFLADPPTHPKLLDWLASEFKRGSESMKTIHRLILTSKTWRQSSLHPSADQYESKDSGNRLCWRSPRRRLDAESLRDSMLAATDELQLHRGGESFKATVSPEALEGLSRGSVDWQSSPEFDQKRRSLYMYIKRGLLPPMMTTFDLCDATGPCGQRDVTTVPTQALALLNNQFVHDRAEFLASQLMAENTDQAEQIKSAWSKILRRQPSDEELQLAATHLKTQRYVLNNPNDTKPPEAEVDKSDEADEPDPEQTKQQPTKQQQPSAADFNDALALHLRADELKENSDDAFELKDLSSNGHVVTQSSADARPSLSEDGFGGQATLVFDGEKQFLKIDGELLDDQAFTIIVVANDLRETIDGTGNRELISNWQKDENTTTSLFLGLTATNTVRFSDAYSFAGDLIDREKPFVLSATNGNGQVTMYQNGSMLSAIPGELSKRELSGPWVIGSQGNFDQEFWKGHIAEIRVYNRALSMRERRLVEDLLASRYEIDLPDAPVIDDPVMDSPAQQPDEFSDPMREHNHEKLALASLCLVLMNSNEFLYVD